MHRSLITRIIRPNKCPFSTVQHHSRSNIPCQTHLRRYTVNAPSPLPTTTTTTATTSREPTINAYRERLNKGGDDVWNRYQQIAKLGIASQLNRQDFVQLRTNLWNSKHKWGAEDRVLQVLNDMKRLGYEWSILEYNEYFMVKLYQARHQDILDTFNGEFQASKLRLSVGSFNVLLAAYLQLNMEKEAIQLIREAHRLWGLHPDIRDFQRTMHRCMPRNSTIGKKARELISLHGFDNVETMKSNLAHLFRKRMLGDIRWLYANAIKPKLSSHSFSSSSTTSDASAAAAVVVDKNVLVYQLLIKGFLDGKSPRDASSIYDDMRQAGYKPNGGICVSMLTIYAAKRDVAGAEQIVNDTVESGYPLDELIYNQLIRVYLKSRMANRAFHVFDFIQRDPKLKVNDVILNTMIDGLVINKELAAAKALYQQMLESRIQPDMVTFNTLLKGFILVSDYPAALEVISDMYKYKCEPDTVTFTTLLDGIFANKQPRSAEEMLDYLHRTGMQPNIYTFNAVISKFIQNQQLSEAERTIELMRKAPYNLKPTIHTYTNLIQGYVATNDLTKAMWTFQNILKNSDMRPDRASYHFIICAFLNHDRLDDAITCLLRMRKEKCTPTKDTWGIMLDECIRRRDWASGAVVVRELEASGFAIQSGTLRRAYATIKDRTA
ncbi:hypothetical protein BDB00DRAFT_832825 [Zychaea mexicana]|uniref:uncharacterized protein n=1 Tax=Zychaea mexicana TaxID=64656 RepID=UPI0022FE1A16|nr:uncharacterized protein BDB00DRAFT_832825 [Zychaea mexicana]KAI9491395.1 hypothetical protein BDB00DRAFT_832825 [Zychaea mexicana]